MFECSANIYFHDLYTLTNTSQTASFPASCYEQRCICISPCFTVIIFLVFCFTEWNNFCDFLFLPQYQNLSKGGGRGGEGYDYMDNFSSWDKELIPVEKGGKYQRSLL